MFTLKYKIGSTLICATACVFFSSCTASSANANIGEEKPLVESKIPSKELDTAHPIDSILKQETIESSTKLQDGNHSFICKNVQELAVDVISIDKIHHFDDVTNGHFRCISTASNFATDFGPYRDLFFVFENHTEMPHHTAVFDIGNMGTIDSFEMKSENIYEVTGVLFEIDETNQVDTRVKVIIDASDVLKKHRMLEETNSDFEGSIESELKVTVVQIPWED